MNWIEHVFTGFDNQTVDVKRLIQLVGVVTFIGYTGYEFYKLGRFNMTGHSLGYSVLLTAGAAGVKIKDTNDPK